MITDVFHKRYPGAFHFYQEFPKKIAVFLRQSAQILFDDLKPYVHDIEKLCTAAYSKLVRELGHGIYNGTKTEEICIGALCENYDLWNNDHVTSQQFIQYRFSLIELLMAEIETGIFKPSSDSTFKILLKSNNSAAEKQKRKEDTFLNSVHELNHRMREAGIPFHYHNKLFQYSTDKLTESQVYEPFWTIVKDKKWQNVDIDIKEAIDRRDSKGRDAALYALKSLESTIKIISDDNGWTRGTERGAANYIDNLVSATNGRFIDVWEAEQIKAIFRDLRNPYGHGPGSAPQPALSEFQESWIIECAMIWIKSLVKRK